jgi:mono/diheme cytochrome c family protein
MEPVVTMRVRIAAAALALMLGATLAGCGGDGDGTTTESATTTETSTVTETGAAAGDVEAGREVFISTGCGSCHTLQAAGTTGQTGPNLDVDLTVGAEAAGVALAEYVRTSIVDPDAWVMPQFSGGVMPSNYEEQLSGEQLDDLVAFIVDSVQ